MFLKALVRKRPIESCSLITKLLLLGNGCPRVRQGDKCRKVLRRGVSGGVGGGVGGCRLVSTSVGE